MGTFTTQEGYTIEIVEYRRCDDMIVQFKDCHGARVKANYSHCKNGSIKNPYHCSIYGVGCLGLKPDGSKVTTKVDGKHTREYKLWSNMMRRCYDVAYTTEHPTYKGVNVCSRWLTYANFLEDLPQIEGYDFWFNNPNKRVALDKDFKGDNSKVYSLETCCFTSIVANTRESLRRNIQTYTNRVKGVNIETGEVVYFNSLIEASRSLGKEDRGTLIGKCYRGEFKTAYGHTWELITNKSCHTSYSGI